MPLFKRKKQDKEQKEEDRKVTPKEPEISGEKREGKKETDKKGEEKIKEKKESKKEARRERDLLKSRAYRVLLKPLVTEKATNLGTENKYVFEVNKKTNKIEVAKAVYDVYKIKPVNVNIINIKGKSIRFGRTQGVRKSWKKAVVTLPKGKTIDVYEGT